MSDPNNKLDFSAISFDDVVGDGAQGLETVQAPQDVEEINDPVIDEDPREYGDEDHEDYVDEEVVEDEEYAVEDDYEEDEDEDEVDIEGLSVADQISRTLGFDLEYEYDDTVEGITNFVRDMSEDVAEDKLQGLFEEFPEVQQHLDYLLAGGSSDEYMRTFNPGADYNNIQMSEGDVTLQRAMLGEYMQHKGHDNEFIMDMLDDYEKSGKLFDKAELAQRHLAHAQQEERERVYQEQMNAAAEQEAEQEEFWDGVAEIIEDGNEFGGIRIADADKQDFFDYISSGVDEHGNTQRDLDYAEAPMEIKLAIDYLMYSGFDLADIIETKARTKSVENLRDRIRSNEDRVKSARKAQRRQQKFDPDQLDINALF